MTEHRLRIFLRKRHHPCRGPQHKHLSPEIRMHHHHQTSSRACNLFKTPWQPPRRPTSSLYQTSCTMNQCTACARANTPLHRCARFPSSRPECRLPTCLESPRPTVFQPFLSPIVWGNRVEEATNSLGLLASFVF